MNLRMPVVLILLSLGVGTRGQTAPTSSPVDRSTPAAGARAVMYAIRNGDVGALADSVLLPIKLEGEQKRLYTEHLLLSSQLTWAVSEKLRGHLPQLWLPIIYYVDVDSLRWQGVKLMPERTAAGAIEQMMGMKDKSPHVRMARTAEGWKLDRVGGGRDDGVAAGGGCAVSK
jgi:hypothetical protein